MSAEQGIGRVAVIGTEGVLGERLAEQFSERGRDVVAVALMPETSLEQLQAEMGPEPIDLLIFADNWAPPERGAADVTRAELAASLHRLTLAPFRLAAQLRPTLAADGGAKLVLLSRASASMEHVDSKGRYLERPFRAAIHALWRCLSAEWQNDKIDCVLIALDDAPDPGVLARLPDLITAASSNGKPVTLIDQRGDTLPW